MKKIKRTMILLMWLILSSQAFSLSFTTTPDTHTWELEYYFYGISVTGNNGPVTITCEKKPDWLYFTPEDVLLEFDATIEGVPMAENYLTNGDSVIIKVSDADTTIYQKFAIYVDVVLVAPGIALEPENKINLYVQYSDTLIVDVFHPEYLEYEIIKMPDFMTFYEIEGSNSIYKYYALKGYLSANPGYNNFIVEVQFHYGTCGATYYSNFSVGGPSFIPHVDNDSKINVISRPFDDEVRIEGVDLDLIKDCLLISATGSKTVIHDLSQIDISTVANGTYFLQITLKTGEVLTKKIIKL